MPLPSGRVIIDLVGTALTTDERQLLLHPALGGLILFSRNISSMQQLQALMAEVRSVRPELLICIDQEGGRVQRIHEPLTRLPPLARCEAVWLRDNAAGEQLAEQLGWLMASEILSLDIDLSFAPVLDLDRKVSAVIGDRAFSSDPEGIHILASAYLAGMRRAGMAATGKHFPGHGAVAPDSHAMLPYDARSWTQISEDLDIFKRLLPQLPALMTAHIVFETVDKQPVAFSSLWLKTILRQQLGYTGLVFCDDLNMAGAKDWITSAAERGQRALDAGCDLLLLCNHRDDAIELLNALQDASPCPEIRNLRAASGWRWDYFSTSDERLASQHTINQLLKTLYA